MYGMNFADGRGNITVHGEYCVRSAFHSFRG
jgi:hypothetical protein